MPAMTSSKLRLRGISGSTFTTQCALPYGQVARTGPAAKIEALLVREYLRQRYALPRRQLGGQMAGGYTDVFVTGVVGPIVYADVESLYPSIMLNYNVRPRTDELDLFQALLRRLTDLRLATKRQMQQATTPEDRSALDAQQSSYKILINSFYGQLGFSMAIFNDFGRSRPCGRNGAGHSACHYCRYSPRRRHGD
jgi:DNA polymerase elongation subunit (family B)